MGHIVSAKKHPDADGLYVEDVNLGEERNRTIISGLVKHIPLEQVSSEILNQITLFTEGQGYWSHMILWTLPEVHTITKWFSFMMFSFRNTSVL